LEDRLFFPSGVDPVALVFKRKALHDWTSHAADAFAYLAMMVDSSTPNFNRRISYPNIGIV
jgi:hypothetical protein